MILMTLLQIILLAVIEGTLMYMNNQWPIRINRYTRSTLKKSG